MNNKVSLHYCEDYSLDEVKESLNKCLDDLGGLSSFIKPKTKVLLKCNLNKKYAPNEALTTHPSIVIALAEIISKHGASSIIFDCPDNYCSDSMTKIYETTQMLDASNYGHAELNTNYNCYSIDYNGTMAKSFTLADTINQVDTIINIPKLIVDNKTGLHGAVDNLFGLIPTEMKIILKNRLFSANDYTNYLIDLYSILKDKLVLNVVDGVVSREANDCQRIMNYIACGANPFYVDYANLMVVGLEPEDNVLLNNANNRGVFNINEKIIILGDKLESFLKPDFCTPKFRIVGDTSIYSKSQQKSFFNEYQQRPLINKDQCKGCGICMSVCPTKAITPITDKNNEICASLDCNKCITCFKCVHECPYNAIKTITPCKYKTLISKLNKHKINNK